MDVKVTGDVLAAFDFGCLTTEAGELEVILRSRMWRWVPKLLASMPSMAWIGSLAANGIWS